MEVRSAMEVEAFVGMLRVEGRPRPGNEVRSTLMVRSAMMDDLLLFSERMDILQDECRRECQTRIPMEYHAAGYGDWR